MPRGKTSNQRQQSYTKRNIGSLEAKQSNATDAGNPTVIAQIRQSLFVEIAHRKHIMVLQQTQTNQSTIVVVKHSLIWDIR